ncbi:hypothetical protein CRG98_028222 [Punica granatum]|uniref:Uncharacterized protein n=1 Tax=Punica granatum TaxID=22663 RepID=A0A2I0J556_PUNGR|nr:hypothetical protein CRG98_028222 [Punica granatum]
MAIVATCASLEHEQCTGIVNVSEGYGLLDHDRESVHAMMGRVMGMAVGRVYAMTRQDAQASNAVVTDCQVEVDRRDLHADLVELEMGDFDVILDMDRISASPVMISGLKATRMLRKGYQGFSASIRDVDQVEPTIQDIPVVCELPDVFLEDLHGLPHDREVESSD